MKRVLITLACVGLSASAANACEFMRSAKATVDQTVVASIAVEADVAISKPQQVLLPEGQPAVAVGEVAR